MSTFFKNYFQLIDNGNHSIEPSELILASEIINKVKNVGGTVFIVGNGGSAAIASHVAIDFTKAANIRATTFNESSLLTCFSNDYGYEHWVDKALESYAKKDDMVILISSSGQSQNIINGAKRARKMELPLITFSGFSGQNKLREMGDVNLWIDSDKYNIVEIVHQNWILSIVDYLIEKNI
jgi:D-sedoheptulose 7-phosphate isomerase